MLKRSMKFATALVASLSLGAAALALPALDTVITQGYDDTEKTVIFGVSEIWEEGDELGATELDCGLIGDFEYELGEADEGSSLTPVTALTEEGEEVTFGWDAGFEVEEGTEEVPYSLAVECGLRSVSVEGPNGQVNHGTVMSSIVHALKEMGLKGNGCLVSAFAKTDLGKGDDKVTVEEAKAALEAAAGAEVTADEDPLDVTLDVLLASCDKGKKSEKPEKAEKAEKPGKPDKADKGKPDLSDKPGNGKGRDK